MTPDDHGRHSRDWSEKVGSFSSPLFCYQTALCSTPLLLLVQLLLNMGDWMPYPTILLERQEKGTISPPTELY